MLPKLMLQISLDIAINYSETFHTLVSIVFLYTQYTHKTYYINQTKPK